MGLYNRLIAGPLESLDREPGHFFKNIFYFIFKISSIGVAIYGAYLLVTGLYGKTGYFTMLRSLDSFEYVRSIICFVLTFAISASMFFVVFFAIILSAIPYAPIEALGNLAGSVGSNMVNTFVGNTFAAIFIESASDYFKLLADGFIGLVSGFIMSVGILFGTYIFAELFEMIIYFLIRKPLYK
jgi:hypothetical protein